MQLKETERRTMADYYTSRQLAQRLGITELAIGELTADGLLQVTVKNGQTFFSSQQAYRLQMAMRWARREKMELKKGLACVEERWLARSGALKD